SCSQFLQHAWPVRRLIAELAPKAAGIEAAVDHRAVHGIDRHGRSKTRLKELEQGILVDRLARDVIDAVGFGKLRQQPLDDPADLERGEPRKNHAPESVDRSALGQEPLQQPELARKLAADE